MHENDRQRGERIALYLTPEHDCSYLPARQTQTLFIDPMLQPECGLYQYLLESGFRRSGDHIYRPECRTCSACVPVRIPVQRFRPRRNQRRCWNALADKLRIVAKPAALQAEHYQLYLKYTAARHPDGGMADADEARYMDFLSSQWCRCQFIEFRLGETLLMVAVTDYLPRSLSAVYTFFDPELDSHSPGTFAILWQVQEALRLKLPHLYLGYWIEGSEKMHYKANFRPLEAWDGDHWLDLEAG